MNIVTDKEFLRKPCDDVALRWAAENNDAVQTMVNNMLDEMRSRDRLGLAANQLGYTWSIITMRIYPTPQRICIVNPEITREKGIQKGEESCLSLPGVIVNVKRPHMVVVKGVNRYGKPVHYMFEGLCARIACHEVDHLNGRLITDYEELKDVV